MSEFYVKWRFAPKSLFNDRDEWTSWYWGFYPDKESAVEKYAGLLANADWIRGLEVKIFELVELVPGQEEKDEDPPAVKEFLDQQDLLFMSRNERIMKLFNEGSTRREIATLLGLSYQTVYAVTRKHDK